MMVAGGLSILVPRFNVKAYANLIKTEKPNFIAGVPTLFEAITRNPYLDGVSLDFLRGVFSGGDSLSVELKRNSINSSMSTAPPFTSARATERQNVSRQAVSPRIAKSAKPA